MRNFTLITASIIISSSINAQILYNEVLPQNIQEGINTDIEFFDMDADGDLDLFTNSINNGVAETFLYENDGNGNFTEVTGPFIGCYLGDIEIGDIDGDGDLDAIVNGAMNSTSATTNIYKNDGSGNFTLFTGHNLPNIGYGAIELGDLDNDGDLDAAVGGPTNGSYPFTLTDGIYINDGTGVFTQNSYAFALGDCFNIGMADINMDGNLDIITGEWVSGSVTETNVHINNGSLNFTRTTIINTTMITRDIIIEDVTADGYPDLIGFGQTSTEIYVNDGNGNLTAVPGNNFNYGYGDCHVDLGDFDNDGDMDLVMVGWNGSGGSQNVAKQFLNDGTGVFTENTVAGFEGVRNGNIEAADINGNGKLEIVIKGRNSGGNDISKIYEEAVCEVTIPDANFKAYLVGNTAINTNGNTEIECSEANNFTGQINCSSLNISDLTGIEEFTSLTDLICSNNQLTTLDLSSNAALISVQCQSNSLTSLDVSSNTLLTTLNCSFNQLNTLNIDNNTALITFTSGYNNLTNINVSNNVNLVQLEVSSNQLSSLNVANNTAVTGLFCDNNNLSSLDVSANGSLNILYCFNNQLSSIDVSGNTTLQEFRGFNNQFSDLDFSNNGSLVNLWCSDNALTSLNVANGNNTNFTFFNATNNPNLTCIEVDDAAWSATNWTDIDATSSFSENCSGGSASLEELFHVFSMYPNPAQDAVSIVSNLEIDKVELISPSGGVIITSGEKLINTSNLASGAYFVKCYAGQTTETQKLIIY